ncbi:MAG: Fis family transcriptional regulator [Micavibrio aeruginosavorus]|uniref:Fis family transcriptional regulator n=1 Tax=Micavibrio aeruginosavorus TaxID=349221 RepID=A0A2W5PRE5_9BACT|nr:MAG: Fis family transcriptional regulator [Micavibrio aeruginosavorus]
MTIQTLTLSQIQPCAMNPRKFFNDTTIEELAQSIKTDGLLQNLVVLKPTGRAKKHTIIAGERRFRAISHLIEKGELDKDFPVRVEIKEGLSNDEALRIATVENVQRENLSPLEEAEALKVLVKDGAEMDTIIAQTGLSLTTIRRRLMLLNLTEKAQEALAEKKITLAQAEALTIGKPEDQDEVVDDVMEGYYTAPDEIKDKLVGELPTLSMAIFPQELYTGTFTKDLLAEKTATYFDDIEQFATLQKQAAEQKVAEYAQTHEWAVLEEGYRFNKWEYDETAEGETGGVVVFLANDGNVTIHEGLTKTKAAVSTTKALKATKEKDFYPTPLRRYMGMHKSLAVQAAILGNPRKAKEIVVCNKLAKFKAHDCLRYFELEGVIPPALEVINQGAEAVMFDLNVHVKDDEPVWKTVGYFFDTDEEKAYDAIQSLTDEQLESILLFLEVCEFGQYMVDRLDTHEDSLFNKVAKDLSVDMRDYWRPDEGFLKRRNKVQLQALMNESGASAKLASAAEYKKGELVKSLTKFFQSAKKAKKPTETDQKANDWLPEAMNFPAIDPDRKEPEVADMDEDFEDEEEVLDGESDELDDEEYSEAA